jgi:hypothetical protein
LWKIHAPPKAKHFLWRICRRRVPCPLLCPICAQHNKDDWHILFTCHDSIQARQAAGLENVIAPRLQHHDSAKDLILEVCAVENRNTAGAVAMLLWTVWNNRNSSVWN